MKTNNRVPLPVLLHANNILYGRRKDNELDDDEIETESSGLWGQRLKALEQANDLMHLLSEEICRCSSCQTPIKDCSDPFITSLTAERNSFLDAADSWGYEIAEVERLADPLYMGEAFELLADEFDDARFWPAFLDAARAARKDFAEYRRLGKEALRLSREISAAADQLEILVRNLRNTGLRLPSILMPRWENGSDEWESLSGSRELQELKIRRMVLFIVDQRNKEEKQAQPDARKFLRELSEACADFAPDFMDPAIEYAIGTRQNSRISAFLRAFAASLHKEKVKITPAVKRAMAITANTLMDDPELNITEDHVRKALANVKWPPKPSGRRARGQSRKTREEIPF